MFVRSINHNQIEEIMELEKKIYGSNKFTKEEYEKILKKNDFSFAYYKNKKIEGFIISKRLSTVKRYKNDSKVIHLVCKSTKVFVLLLLVYVNQLLTVSRKGIIYASVDSKMNNLITKLKCTVDPVIGDIVSTLDEKTGMFNLEVPVVNNYPHNTKLQILTKILEDTKNCVNLTELLHDLLTTEYFYKSSDNLKCSIPEVKKYKNMILRVANQKNLELLNMLWKDELNIMAVTTKLFNKKSIDKCIETIRSSDLKENDTIDIVSNCYTEMKQLDKAILLDKT